MRLSKRVFEIDKIFMGIIPTGDYACRFDYQTLEVAIKDVIRTKLNDPNAVMADRNPTSNHVPTFVVATDARHADGNPTLFRSYGCRGHNPDKCFIWEAARATSAAPTFFKPITIAAPAPGRTFVDGGLTYNNPAEPALEEAQRLWPDSSKCCLVSIGTGRLSSVKVMEQPSKPNESNGSRFGEWIPGKQLVGNLTAGAKAVKAIAEACVQLTTNSEPAHQRLFKQSFSRDSGKRFPYHRFNVERDMQDIGLEEWEKWEEMAAHTAAYMEAGEGIQKRDRCVEDLMRAGRG
jgi:patatin-like phospholipase/acyl hydrolase